jgi:hypothetical protein
MNEAITTVDVAIFIALLYQLLVTRRSVASKVTAESTLFTLNRVWYCTQPCNTDIKACYTRTIAIARRSIAEK